jgi:hypothetical protein
MTPDTRLALQQILDYCHAKWEETDKAGEIAWPTPDMQTGKKMAYNDVLQHARKLMGETP